MREKILAQLVAKHAGVSKQFLGLVADKLAKKVTEESGIDQAITDYDNAVNIQELAQDFQREADRRVGDAKKEWEKKNPPKPAPKTKEEGGSDDESSKPEDVPAWAKTLMDGLQKLQSEKSQSSIQAKAAEKLKDVPALFWKGRALPDKEEDLDSFIETINTDFNSFKQEQIDKGLMSQTPPGGGGGAGGGEGDKKVIDQDIKDWATKNKPATDTKNK
jgi:hypothetical protein